MASSTIPINSSPVSQAPSNGSSKVKLCPQCTQTTAAAEPIDVGLLTPLLLTTVSQPFCPMLPANSSSRPPPPTVDDVALCCLLLPAAFAQPTTFMLSAGRSSGALGRDIEEVTIPQEQAMKSWNGMEWNGRRRETAAKCLG
jgi:hypothetical protein